MNDNSLFLQIQAAENAAMWAEELKNKTEETQALIDYNIMMGNLVSSDEGEE